MTDEDLINPDIVTKYRLVVPSRRPVRKWNDLLVTVEQIWVARQDVHSGNPLPEIHLIGPDDEHYGDLQPEDSGYGYWNGILNALRDNEKYQAKTHSQEAAARYTDGAIF